MRNLLVPTVIALSSLTFSAAYAEEPIQGAMQAFVVEQKDNRETLIATNEVEPDQLVEYQLTYTNQSDSKINGLTVVGPVPEGTTYVSNTAIADVAALLVVSIDGGKTFEPEPVIRVETKSNGEVVERVVPPAQYTHIKWQAESAIQGDGGTQLYSYRVRIK